MMTHASPTRTLVAIALPLALALAAALVARPALACELPAGDVRVEGKDGLSVSYRTEPSGFAVDRHFALIVHVCPSAAVTSLTVDAHMPEHRHGMNYKPGITRLPSGGWRADGLLFHMPGKWELVFGVDSGRGVVRVTRTIVIS